MSHLTQREFEQLLSLRTSLRHFLRWSEHQAKAAGLTPAHHHLLLAIRGHPDPEGPTIGSIAESLMLRHHSVVGLVDRAVRAGLIRRAPDARNSRIVRLRLTPHGLAKLEALADAHRQELAKLVHTMQTLWESLERAGDVGGGAALAAPAGDASG